MPCWVIDPKLFKKLATKVQTIAHECLRDAS
eukprot:COSAG01_NODE_59011_length_302_cov_1.522167_1_plen_30_part_10